MDSITLKAARVNAGFTQSDVEKELGYSRNTLTRWETGKTQPRADALKKLCDLYGVSMAEITIKKIDKQGAGTPRPRRLRGQVG